MAIVYKVFTSKDDTYFVSFNVQVKPASIIKMMNGEIEPSRDDLRLVRFSGHVIEEIPENYKTRGSLYGGYKVVGGKDINRYIKDVNPSLLLSDTPEIILPDVLQRDCSWLMSGDTPLCIMNIKFKEDCLSYKNDVVEYHVENKVYISTMEYARHRPDREYQNLKVNVKIGLCTLGVVKFDGARKVSYRSVFDLEHRLWNCTEYNVDDSIISVKRG